MLTAAVLVRAANCISWKYVSFIFALLAIFVYIFRLSLIIVTAIYPCEQLGGRQATDNIYCLGTLEIAFRFILASVTAIVIGGHFAALITEDSILIGTVLGAEVALNK